MIPLNLAQIYYPPSPKVTEKLCEIVKNANVFPEIGYPKLKEKLSDYFGVEGNNILPANGLDEAIYVTAPLFKGKKVVIPLPNYAEYKNTAEINKCEIVNVSCLNDSFDLKIPERMLKTASLIWISNPNNPTRCKVKKEKIIDIIESTKATVVVDECYFEFCNETVIDLVNKQNNLIVLRGFGKTFALSGLRAGFIISNQETIKKIQPTVQPFNMNTVAATACIEVLSDLEYYKGRWKELAELRSFFKKALEDIGVFVYDSFTNFVLLRFKSKEESDKVFEALKSNGVMTCYCDTFIITGLEGPYLRITINNKDIMQKVVDIIKTVV